MSMEWSSGDGKYISARILSAKGEITDGKIIATFSQPFADLLNTSFVMPYAKALLSVDERNPSTYHLGRKLLTDWNMKHRNKQKPGVISVRALLEACPDLPERDKVTDRAYSRRIQQPFENALDSLADNGIIRWHFCNEKGAGLREKQEIDFLSFLDLYVAYEILKGGDERHGSI